MIEKNNNIPVSEQRKYLEAENKSYVELINAGYLPQGYDFKQEKVVIYKRENEHKSNQHTEVYYFKNWQEAKEKLCRNKERK